MKLLRRRIDVPFLSRQPGRRYEGTVQRGEIQRLRNKHTGQMGDEAVLVFNDGLELVLTQAFLRLITNAWGGDTDRYRGQRLGIVLTTVTFKNGTTQDHRRVYFPDAREAAE